MIKCFYSLLFFTSIASISHAQVTKSSDDEKKQIELLVSSKIYSYDTRSFFGGHNLTVISSR